VNRLRAAFLDPREKELHRDWQNATVGVVGQLRAASGTEGDDPRGSVSSRRLPPFPAIVGPARSA
ncbi:MAG: hypothetical protein QOF44_3314, partial [Streptomyces sp.]|nr:hypothetical protein [Streptomyces sp.]